MVVTGVEGTVTVDDVLGAAVGDDVLAGDALAGTVTAPGSAVADGANVVPASVVADGANAVPASVVADDANVAFVTPDDPVAATEVDTEGAGSPAVKVSPDAPTLATAAGAVVTPLAVDTWGLRS